jgi:hypothetical protein
MPITAAATASPATGIEATASSPLPPLRSTVHLTVVPSNIAVVPLPVILPPDTVNCIVSPSIFIVKREPDTVYVM